MQKFATLSDAIALAEFAHRNQLDKAGMPYIEHPRRVLEKVKAMGGLPYVQIAAILHDVTEDTAFSSTILRQLGFSEAAIDVVDLLDRGRSAKQLEVDYNFERRGKIDRPSNDEYYYREIAKNPGAKKVKLADIEDNLSPWRLTYLSDDTQARLQAKYAKAKELLGA